MLVRLKALWPDVREALVPWTTGRMLLAVSMLAARLSADRLLGPGAPRPVPLRQGLFAWDGAWYRAIAEHGYRGLPVESSRFFPGFPLAGRLLAPLFLGRTDVALLVVANGCGLVVLVLVARLARRELGERVAAIAPWVVTLAPSAFVLALGYAESMYLALALACLMSSRSRAWKWVALWGMLAALTRPTGALLALAVGVEATREWSTARAEERVWRAIATAAPIAGFGAFIAYAATLSGGWTAPLRVQSQLRGGVVEPVSHLARSVGDVVTPSHFGDGLHAPFGLAMVVLVVVAWRKLPASFALFSTAVIVVSLSAGNLNSIERYGLNAIPLVLAMAALVRRYRLEVVVTALAAGVLTAVATLAFIGSYVP
ncbi:MAG: hypothetical protein QOD72_2276 [Acidimicrobiaceae bacterium]|nr:hypothetical protein [Acidimicrobiaceae bacterium]